MTRRRILLIFPASTHRDALARLLAREGHEVEVAGERGSDDPIVAGFDGDIVVCDAAALGGAEVVREVEERTRAGRYRLLLLGGESERPWNSREGIDRLARPVNMEELRRVLRDG